MALLPRQTARRFFPEFESSIRDARRPGVWGFEHAAFPFVAVTVLDERGRPLHGVVLNAEDWPLRPPRVMPTSLDFRRLLRATEVQRKVEGAEAHVYEDPKRPGQGAYFCVEGTWEFHQDYARAVPWHDVRHLPEFQPAAILDNVVDLIDRKARTPAGVGP